MPVVGFVNAASAENYKRQVAAFLEGLAQNGYIDGEKVKVEYRWAEGQYDRMSALITELLGRQAAVISVTGSTAAAQAAMAATRTIPTYSWSVAIQLNSASSRVSTGPVAMSPV
jgi:putative tryptophan/tyrosine transport system substrate-binding protein